jgi:hypothetical protein
MEEEEEKEGHQQQQQEGTEGITAVAAILFRFPHIRTPLHPLLILPIPRNGSQSMESIHPGHHAAMAKMPLKGANFMEDFRQKTGKKCQ